MELFDSLRMGSNALIAQQAALQVVGNNIANSATPGYARQAPVVSSVGESRLGLGVTSGGGVQLTDVRRIVNESIQQRLRDAQSQLSQNQIADETLSRVEALMSEMTDKDISTGLTDFFNAFSRLAGSPQDDAIRNTVLQKAGTLCDRITYVRNGLENIRTDLTDQLDAAVSDVNRLASDVADLNRQIVAAESNGSTASTLRDQRDAVLSKLSDLLGVTAREDANGAVNLYVGSEPLVYGGDSRGIRLEPKIVNGETVRQVVFSDNGGTAELQGGKIKGLQDTRDGELTSITQRLDELASQVIWQVNRIQSSGTLLDGANQFDGTYPVKDVNAALDSEATELPYQANSGSFLLTVTNKTTGAKTTTQVDVNLDGTAAGMSLAQLKNRLNAIGGVQAGYDSSGHFTIKTTDANARISFGQDTSGVLAALGINTFFAGSNASTMAVNSDVAADAGRIAAGRQGEAGDGTNAAAIAALADAALADLGGASLTQFHQRIVADTAIWASGAGEIAQANQVVCDSLTAQRESVSGVSLDEEAVSLMVFQRAFQGSARFISVVNEMLDTLMKM